jgi:Holliday junction DNA helicase RuvA
MTTSELESVIVAGNVNQLKTVKGIGLKTAQRIIIDLKDKIQKIAGGTSSELFVGDNSIVEESVAALVMLGFNQAASHKAVAQILKQTPNATIEQTIKAALKVL